MTGEQFWDSLGMSVVWFAFLAIVNAGLGGLLPFWSCAVLGLVLGFLATSPIRRHRADSTSGGPSEEQTVD